MHYDPAPRPQRSCFANPNLYVVLKNEKRERKQQLQLKKIGCTQICTRYQLGICFNLPGKAGRHYNLCVRYELAICYNCLADDKGVLLKSVCRGMCLTGMGGGEVFYSVALLAGTLAGISGFCPKIINLFSSYTLESGIDVAP